MNEDSLVGMSEKSALLKTEHSRNNHMTLRMKNRHPLRKLLFASPLRDAHL